MLYQCPLCGYSVFVQQCLGSICPWKLGVGTLSGQIGVFTAHPPWGFLHTLSPHGKLVQKSVSQRTCLYIIIPVDAPSGSLFTLTLTLVWKFTKCFPGLLTLVAASHKARGLFFAPPWRHRLVTFLLKSPPGPSPPTCWPPTCPVLQSESEYHSVAPAGSQGGFY